MITCIVPEYEVQPTIGQVVNVYDPSAKAVVAAKIMGEPVWGYNGIDDCNYASYPLKRVRLAAHGDFPRMEDGGCAVCNGIGCDACNHSGGY